MSQNLAGTTQLAALSTPPVVSNVQGAIQLPPQPAPSSPAAGGGQQPPPGLPARVIDIPPPNETRFIQDEVILQIAGNITVEQLQAAVAQLGLTLLASQNLAITGSTAVQFRITDGRTPADIIRALAAIQLVAVAQPNYVYSLEQTAPADQTPASRGDTGQQGDAAQYILDKLKMLDVHRMVRGANITIAVIDFGNRCRASRSGRRGRATLQRGRGRAGKAARPRHRHGGCHGRASEDPGNGAGRASPRRACLLQQRRQGREHHVQYPQRHRLVGGPGRAHHQYELCRPEGSVAPARAQARLRQGHRAGRRRRQCRGEFTTAVSRRRSAS